MFLTPGNILRLGCADQDAFNVFERKMPLTLCAMYDLTTFLSETEHLATSV